LEIGKEKYVTVGRAATYLGVSASTLRNWDRNGRFPARRHPINGYRLYSMKDLDILLEEIRDYMNREER